MENTKKTSAQSIVKGLLITSVIFFHALMFCVLPNTASVLTDFNILFIMFPFLMMVFFFYAGYNYTPNKRTPGQSIKRRCAQLLIPLVVTFTLSTCLIMAIRIPTGESWEAIKNGILYSLMSEPLAQIIGFPGNGIICFDLVLALGILWFLYALFIVSVIFYLIVNYAIKKLSRLISIIVLCLIIAFSLGQFVGVYLPYTVQCYPVALAIMLLAAYLKQSNFLDREYKTKKDVIFTISNVIIAEGIIVGIGLVGYFIFGSTMVGSLPGGKFDATLKGFDVFTAFAIGFLGTFVIHHIGRLIEKVPVLSTVLNWYGERSSYVYLSHPIFLSFAHYVIFSGNVIFDKSQAYLYVFIAIGMLVIIFLFIDLIKYKIKQRKKSSEDLAK